MDHVWLKIALSNPNSMEKSLVSHSESIECKGVAGVGLDRKILEREMVVWGKGRNGLSLYLLEGRG